MSLVAALKSPGPNGFGYGSTAEQVTAGVDLSGKTFLLTGVGAGLGLETLRVIALRGGHVIAAARSKEKAAQALAAASARGTPVACDLSEPASVRACVRTVKELGRTLDGVICNAGIMALPRLEQRYGCELQFFTNHVGHFLLVTGVLELLAREGRVVVVSSDAHRMAPPGGIQLDNLSGERGYTPWRSYGQSKLANLLFARHLAKRLAGTRRTANALHPGVIRTELGRHLNAATRLSLAIAGPLFLKTIAQGAATQCYLAASPLAAAQSGRYFADCNPARPSRAGEDDGLAERLWKATEEIVSRLS